MAEYTRIKTVIMLSVKTQKAVKELKKSGLTGDHEVTIGDAFTIKEIPGSGMGLAFLTVKIESLGLALGTDIGYRYLHQLEKEL